MPQEKFVKREWNNGHKTFVTSEAKAFNELLHSEKTRRDYFDAHKHEMTRDRNPLIGDPTPRIDLVSGKQTNQEPIINPNWVPRPLPDFVTKKEKMTEKIGIETSKYHFLGNTYMTQTGDSRLPPSASPEFRPSSSAEMTGQNVLRSSPISSRPPSSFSQQQSHPPSALNTGRSTGSRPGSDWKNRMTSDGTLKPMIRFF